MAHNCHPPNSHNPRTWKCPWCGDIWATTSKKQAAKSRNENIRIGSRRPWLFGK